MKWATQNQLWKTAGPGKVTPPLGTNVVPSSSATMCCKHSDRAEWGVCIVPQRDRMRLMPHTAGLPMKPHFSKLPQYSLSTVASKETLWFVGKLPHDSILHLTRTYIQYSLEVIWNTLLPRSIISVLFSCRIQSCIGFSYSVDCCLCWGRQRMRIGFPQQKERVALMFTTCQRSSPLHLSLTSRISLMVTFVVIIFALVLTRHFSDVEVASCRLQCNGCSAFSFLLPQLSFKRVCGREKK